MRHETGARQDWLLSHQAVECGIITIGQIFNDFSESHSDHDYINADSPGWPKILVIQFSYMENANHTFFMQFHKYRKLHERSMISIFSYMEIVWLAFFHKPKILIFCFLISQQSLVMFVTKHKWHKPWLSNVVTKGLAVSH